MFGQNSIKSSFYILALGGTLLIGLSAADLDDVGIVVKVQAAGSKFGLDEMTTDKGRLVLVDEMIKYPEQLSKDLSRINSLEVGVKADRIIDVLKKPYTPILKMDVATRRGLSPMQIYTKIAQALIQAVSETDNKSTLISEDSKGALGQIEKLGQFRIAEIIYTLSQNFSSTPQAKFYEANPDQITWGAPSGDPNSKLEFNIVYSLKNKTITVTATSTKLLIDTTGESSTNKPFVTVSSAVFNLASGTVDYFYSYSLDKKLKSFGPLKEPF